MNKKRKIVTSLLVPLALAVAIATWLALDPGFKTERGSSRVESQSPAGDFERRVRAYILNNPEVIVEAMQRLQARRRAAELGQVRATLKARADEVFRDPDSPVGGNPDGDVTIVEFFDYNCPYCRRVAPTMQKAEAADGKLRIVYKEFPILGPNSTFVAKAALAAHRQGKYLAFHKMLMQFPGAADETAALAIASKVGLDIRRLKADMEHPSIKAAIARNLALAQALRINGTPAFVVGDEIVRGAVDLSTLQKVIKSARGRQ